MKVLLNYVPQVYPGKVTLFRASETVFLSNDGPDNDQLGWDRVAAGGLEIHKVPGNHNTLLAEPHVQVLAPKLKTCIEESLAEA